MADAKIRIVAVDDATAAINRVKAGLSGLSAPLSALSGLGLAAGLTQSVGAIRDMVNALDDLDEAAQGLGVTAVALAEMRTAAQQSGVGAEQLDKALTGLNDKIRLAIAGNKDAVYFFKQLGIAFQEAGRPRDVLKVLGDLADRLKGFENDAAKAGVEIEAFGAKIGPKLAAFLGQGSEGLRKFSGLTAETVDEANKLQSELDKLNVGWQRIKNTLLGELLPVLNDYIAISDRLAKSGRTMEGFWRGWLSVFRDVKKELADEKALKAFSSGTFLLGERIEDPTGRKTTAPRVARNPEEEARLKKFLDESRDAANEFKKESLKAKLDEEEQAFRRAAKVVDEYNRELRDSVDAAEEYRQAGLAEYHRQEEASAARARAQLEQYNADLAKTADAANELGLVFESAVSRLFAEGDLTASNFFKSLGRDIAQVITKILIVEPLIKKLTQDLRDLTANAGGGTSGGSLIGTFLDFLFKGGNTRAAGGPVSGGSPYLVGERGPEIFVPSMSGAIVPNGGMGVTIVQNNSINGNASPSQIRAILEISKAETLREVRNQMARRGVLARV